MISGEERLLLARVRARARLRVAWLRHLAGSDPIEMLLAESDSPEAEAAWLAEEDARAGWREPLEALERELREHPDSRLCRLARIFDLRDTESDLLQACLAVALDPPLADLFACLNGAPARSYVTVHSAARLFGYGRQGMCAPESPLFRWGLIESREVEPGALPMLVCDPQVADWFRGGHELEASLVELARPVASLDPLPSWPVETTAGWIRRVWESDPAARIRVVVAGAAGAGRKTFAESVAKRLRMALLALDTDGLPDSMWRHAFVRGQRQAYLDSCALAWQGEVAAGRPWPAGITPFPLQFLIVEPGASPAAAPGILDYAVQLPLPGADERLALWRRAAPASAAWDCDGLAQLAARHQAAPGEIAAAGRQGVANAEEASQAIREVKRGRLGPLAQIIECPFRMDDLVVSAPVREALEDLLYEAGSRTVFWESEAARRMFPQGRGLVALLSGPAGTGKTMAAQVLAAELGFDLYRIDLSAVVSKWVGETEKNLELIFRQAAGMDIVLLFDEADALFGKRTTEMRDAQDKFANMDSGHLLTSIENFPGIAILTTNLKGNIDSAFLRRIRYVIDFSKPDAAQRLEIWNKVIAALAGAETAVRLKDDLSRLASGVEATGAQIKFGVLGALFRARREERPLAAPHLLLGLNRELIKEGRALGARETRRLEGNAN